MRYMGAMGDNPPLQIPGLPPSGGAPLDPALKAQLLAAAPNIPQAQAQDLFDVADATTVGQSTKWMRIGLGAAGGLVLGLVAGKLFFR